MKCILVKWCDFHSCQQILLKHNFCFGKYLAYYIQDICTSVCRLIDMVEQILMELPSVRFHKNQFSGFQVVRSSAHLWDVM